MYVEKDKYPILKEIEEVFKKHTGEEDIGFGIAFTLRSEGFTRAHYVTNLQHSDGIKLFEECANGMKAQDN
jgi:hypothetical protein